MTGEVEIGIDVGIYGRLADPENVLGLARFAEERGYHSIWLADHVVFPTAIESKYPYSPSGAFPVAGSEPLLEPIAAMGVLVGATQRIKIGTAVLVMPYRNPLLLARMLITLDVFSGGRIVLGAGAGWLEEEFAALHAADFAARGAVTDEYLEIFKAVCAGGEVSYEGAHYRFDPVHCQPPSVQHPHPPIVIGGTSNPALRRVARLGDGWMSVALDPGRIPERLAKLAEYCEERGRRLDDLWLCHKLFLSIGVEKQGVHGGRELGTGSIKTIIDDIKRIRDHGYRTLILRYQGSDAAEQIRQFGLFADKIRPRI
jgi:probable F420-dependent oxidoreductase